MAGYVIHLAVAEEYIRKHPQEIEDYNEFIEGVIYPDSVANKSLTHYGINSSKVVLKNFLEDKRLDTDFNKGYFTHLYTDYLFYNKFLEYFSKDIYNDYDILNKFLVDKYKVNITNNIKDKVFFKEGNTKLLDLEKVIKFIEETSDYNIYEIEKKVEENNEFWNTLKQVRKV